MLKANPLRTHVIKRGEGWAVLKEGAGRASRTYGTKQEAVKHAKKEAKAGGDLVIHTPSGAVEEWIHYYEKKG